MRTHRILAVVVVVLGLLGGGTQSAGESRFGPQLVTVSRAALSDLSPATTDPTDGAQGLALAVSANGRTRIMLFLWGLDMSQSGVVHGAHVHVGPCVAGSGAAAGPHYNSSGGTTIDETTEVWLDFTITRFGSGFASATVPFVIPAGGAQSVVIHAAPTAPNGTAGPRLACLPLEF